MQSYKTTVTREDQYRIIIDPQVWNEAALKEWSSVFFDIDTLEELAAHLAQMVARFGYERFIEGFGYVKVFFQNGWQFTHYSIPGEDLCKGIELHIISDDEDCYAEAVLEDLQTTQK